MTAYILRRILWMIPTFLAILIINFGILRLRVNPLENAQLQPGVEGTEMDPSMIASLVETSLAKARRTGQDLPALINFRGFTDKEDVVEWLRALERQPGVLDSRRGALEKRLWLQGRFAVEGLYGVLSDPQLKELHGAGSFAFSLCAYMPLNQEVLDQMSRQEIGEVQRRNRRLKDLRITFTNSEAEGFVITDPAYDEKLGAIKQFWQEHGETYRIDTGEALAAIFLETGFVDFCVKLFTGRLYSYEKNRYVFELIGERWGVTFTLQLLSLVLAWSISIPLGIRSARRSGTLEDNATTTTLFLLWSLPQFFVGALLLHYLCTDTATREALFPNRGLSSPGSEWMSTPRYLLDVAYHGLLPLICLTYADFTVLSRFMRGNMLDQFDADYVRTARAKGLDEDSVVYRHALPNSLITMITLGAGLLASLFGAFVIVEYIFSINGLGTLLLDAAKAQDAPLVMGSTIISVLLLLIGIIIADILYGVVDPRIRNRYA